MIKCQLCNEEFGQITGSHLKQVHGISTTDYMNKFPDAFMSIVSETTKQQISETLTGRKASEETCRRMSETLTGRSRSAETRQLLSEAARERWKDPDFRRRTLESMQLSFTPEARRLISESRLGKALSTEARRKISEANTGRTPSEESRQKMSEALQGHPVSEETRQKLSEAHTGKVMDKESRWKMSEARKILWKDPVYQLHQLESYRRRPTQPELELQDTLDRYYPNEWKYVGDGQVWIGGKNPDFINVNGKKQVIEVFGLFWHSEDEVDKLITHYKTYGFDCLVIWECDTLNEGLILAEIGLELYELGGKQ